MGWVLPLFRHLLLRYHHNLASGFGSKLSKLSGCKTFLCVVVKAVAGEGLWSWFLGLCTGSVTCVNRSEQSLWIQIDKFWADTIDSCKFVRTNLFCLKLLSVKLSNYLWSGEVTLHVVSEQVEHAVDTTVTSFQLNDLCGQLRKLKKAISSVLKS